MIIANITTFFGISAEAEHYYCNFVEKDVIKPDKMCYVSYFDEELRCDLSEEERNYLKKKDGGYIGRTTKRYEI